MATRIKGVLFDKDGTLIDFTASWRGLVDETIADYAAGDDTLAGALGAAIGYDRATGLFLPGSPVVAGTTDEVALMLAALLPGRSAAGIEDEINRRAAAAGAGDAAGVAPVSVAATGRGQRRLWSPLDSGPRAAADARRTPYPAQRA